MPTRWNVNASDTSLAGLMAGSDSSLQALQPALVRGDQLPRQIHVFEQDLNSAFTRKELKRRDITGGSLKVTVSSPDRVPTSGTFDLSYGGSTNNLTGLSVTITAAALQTAMLLNDGINGIGGVVVTGGDGVFTVRFNLDGAKQMITHDELAGSNSMYPLSEVDIKQTMAGASNVREEQVIRLLRKPFAQSEDWTVTTDSTTGTVTLPVTGSSSAYGVAELNLPEGVIGGSFRLTFGGVAERYKITVGHGTPADFNNLFFDGEDSAGPVRFWFDYNTTGTAPTTPPGGRLVEIDLAVGDNTAALIAAKIQAEIALEAQFSGTYIFGPSTVVAVVNTTAGARTDPSVSSPLSGYLTFTVHVDGENGITAEFPWDVTQSQLDDIFGDDWTVTQTGTRQFRFVATELGAKATPTISNNLQGAQYFDGVLALNETSLYQEFGTLDVDTDPIIEAFLEMEYTGTDGYPETILRLPVIVTRDNADSDSIASDVAGTNLDGTVLSKVEFLARLNLAVLQ